jgi:membrane protease YdiL (CAAX protease family)
LVKLIRIDTANLIVLAYFYKKRIKVSIKEAFFLNRFSPQILIPIAITVLGLGIILSEIDNLFRLILPMPQFIQDIYMQYLFNRQSMLASIIGAVIFGPIIEELMFRGTILHGFLGRYRHINAIILSSLLFAIIHLNPWQLISAFIIGCFLGWILVRTRSLYPCIIAHAFNNFIPCIIFYSGIEIPGYSGEVLPTNIFQPLWLDLCGILLILLGIMILRRQLSNKLI